MKKRIPPFYRDQLQGDRPTALLAGGCSARALVLGAVLCALIALGVPYGGLVVQGTRLGLSSLAPAAFFLLFLLLVVVQPLLRLLRRGWALSAGELAVIFIMMAVATAIPTRGVIGALLPMVSGAHYYATPDNKWANLVHPLLPTWLVVDDPVAATAFYQGGSPILWHAWLPVLGVWLLFYAAFYLTLTCVLVILRRQWVEHERLAYPLAQVPLTMLEGDRRQQFKTFFKRPAVWIGFAVPFLLNSINALNHYFPSVPFFSFETRIHLGPNIPVRLGLNFLMLGFAYLINSSIALSVWFFYLVHLLQERFLQVAGQHSGEIKLGPWTDPGAGHQMLGALGAMLAYSLWSGRAHLKGVLRTALGKTDGNDDSGELMSYRSAVLGALVGLVSMGLWLWLSGLPAWTVPLVLATALILFIGLARVVAEAGVPTITPAIIPAGFALSAVGTSALGPAGIVATSFTLVWAGDLLAFMAAPLANVLRLGGEVEGRRRPILGAVAAAMLISLIVSACYTLYLGHRYGAVNLHSQYFKTFAQEPAKFIAQNLSQAIEPSLPNWLWTGFGGMCMGLLVFARQRWAGWPFHPLGFAISAGWIMDRIWFSVFLAWATKSLVLRYGGAALFHRSKYLFLGMALGQIVVGGFWLVIDSLTGTVGNRIRVY